MSEAAIIESLDRFCVYGVATDYDGLLELIRYRLEELQTTHESVDDVSGLQSGYVSKIVAPAPIKGLGRISMGPLLQTLGLALIVARDDEQFAKIKHRLAKRERPRAVLPNGSIVRPTWLFTRKTSLKMQALRTSKLSPKQRKKIARIAGIASGKARRRKGMRERLKERAAKREVPVA